jgi:hypothetical protein
MLRQLLSEAAARNGGGGPAYRLAAVNRRGKSVDLEIAASPCGPRRAGSSRSSTSARTDRPLLRCQPGRPPSAGSSSR